MTAKRFTSMYNGQSDMIQYVDTLKEEPNKWSICNVSETLKKLNELHEENKELKKENEQLKERNDFLRKQLDRVCIDNETMGDKLKQIGRIL